MVAQMAAHWQCEVREAISFETDVQVEFKGLDAWLSDSHRVMVRM